MKEVQTVWHEGIQAMTMAVKSIDCEAFYDELEQESVIRGVVLFNNGFFFVVDSEIPWNWYDKSMIWKRDYLTMCEEMIADDIYNVCEDHYQDYLGYITKGGK